MDQKNKSRSPKLGWTFRRTGNLRLEVKRGRPKGARLGRRVVLLDRDVQNYLAEARDHAA